MTKANGCLRIAEDDGARFRPGTKFNAGRICSVAVIAFPCPTAADVTAHAADVRTIRAQMWPLQRPVAPPVPIPAPALPAPPELDLAAAQSRLLAAAPPAAPGRIAVRRVVEVTADHFGTTVPALLSDCRTQPLARRRQVAMFVARRVTGRSLPFIGFHMSRDHTTILHGVRAVRARIQAGDDETVGAVHQIIERLQIAGGAHD
jgi:Bacterial dnaA protein helix-turn-helix